MHSDASMLGYGGTLGSDLRPGTEGDRRAQGFWTSDDRRSSIALLELRAVRLLLAESFARYVDNPQVRLLLLHEDNRAVVSVINSMFSASKPMMAELRKLNDLLRVYNVTLDARWLPSAVNKFADSLSRTWDPGDVRVTEQVVHNLTNQYRLDHVAFRHRPLNEPMPVRWEYVSRELQSPWIDGRARLWTPPFDLLPLVLHKLRVEGGGGLLVAPSWQAQPWYRQMVRLISRIQDLPEPGRSAQVTSDRPVNTKWHLVLAEIPYRQTGSAASITPFCPGPGSTRPPAGLPRRHA